MPDQRRLAALLTPPARAALEAAAEHALRETHAQVEPEHLLLALCRNGETDLALLLRDGEIDPATLAAGLTAALARIPRGSPRIPALSATLLNLLTAAWIIASIDHALDRIGSATILAAIASDAGLSAALLASVPALAPALASPLLHDLPAWMRRGNETAAAEASALDTYTTDLTAHARAGQLNPAIGRDAEIRQLIDVLMRRQQNNPLLAGPSGTGKTAIVEGLAIAIADGKAPPRLAGLAIRSLDLGLLQAGASMRGELEQRLRRVIEEAAAATPRTILFIDEAHMLTGTDAANLLKPALARGALAVIAATTWSEYKRHIEKDAAFARRFQLIRIAEPAEPAAIDMLRALAPSLESHHNVQILEEALADAVRLSHRFIPARHLPEKAVSVLDTACARIAIARTTPPPELQDAERRAASLHAELTRLRRESALNPDLADRIDALEEERDKAEDLRLRLHGRWALEQETLARLATLESRLEDTPEDETLRQLCAGLRLEIEEMQQDRTASLKVDSRAIAEVISGWTGIPVGRMLTDRVTSAQQLKQRMAERIVEQDAALDAICRRIQTFFADLAEPNKPTGVFLLCGPSGVGKTETALTLAELLFGGPAALVTVNMSEYQEAHSVSGLRGAPPGYVGYGAGGILTEAVRRQPYCVLLLDEVEKAHPDVIEMFYQVFDRGMLEDSEGQLVDFTNTIILLTSNAGAETLAALTERNPSADAATLAAALRPALLSHFPAAFLGRLIVVPYRPLSLKAIEAVARLKLGRIQERFAATGRGALTYPPALTRAIAEQAGATQSGARMVDSILTHSVLPALSAKILDRIAEGRPITGAHLTLAPDNAITAELRG